MPHAARTLVAAAWMMSAAATARGDTLFPDQRAAALAARMSVDQMITLVDSLYAVDANFLGPVNHKPAAALGSAAWTPGIPELGLPPLEESDAGLGVANPADITGHPVRGMAGASIATPSGLATAATWNPAVAFAAGRMIGGEARAEGFNVLLAGGANLVRDARNGRNFEYAGEDPWLAGVIVGNEIRGIQSAHVISTIKHFALNDYETNRFTASADIDWATARESDLLAFEIAIELGQPGSVMCSYNRVNGEPACGSDMLLNRILKGDWHYPGWVMSDWGAVHALSAANAGLDQESGDYFDIPNGGPFFTDKLRQAVAHGEIGRARLEDMARRIIRSELAVGIGGTAPAVVPIDAAADRAVAQSGEEQGAVLLKNGGGVLPLHRGETIAVIGGNAANGVLEGSGSSLVVPVGGPAPPTDRNRVFPHPIVWLPSSPLAALRQGNAGAQVSWSDGASLDRAVAAARAAKVAIVFADQWMTESLDAKSLALPPDAVTGADQDRLIAAVAAANPHTIVVIESGGPVAMPWLDKVSGVIEAWYPGAGGGEALARLIFGEVTPSGHLPVTFPAAETQLPRPAIPSGQNVDYRIEGAAVGYKWFRKTGRTPLFAFGHGLSYTSFTAAHLRAAATEAGLRLSLDVTNTGTRPGQAVPQFYVSLPEGEAAAPFRLVGFDKTPLAPGETRAVTVTVDPRLLANFDDAHRAWRIVPGRYTIGAGFSAIDLPLTTQVTLSASRVAP